MQPLERLFADAKHRLIRRASDYICVALDETELILPKPEGDLEAYLGSLLGEVWNHSEPSWRLGGSWTRGGRLKRIGFLIMCERACRNES